MRDLIRKSPPWIKKPIRYVYGLIPYEKRLGKVFWDTYNFLQESQWWSKEQLEEYQMRQLEKLLKHSYENVPYYRRIFDERGLKPKDIQDFDDFIKLPYLTKDIFRENFNTKEIISKNINLLKLPISHTSGTTGKPLQFYVNIDEGEKEWAFICHQWSRIGYKPGDKRMELRGAINKKEPIFYSKFGNILRFSPIIENKERAKLYLKKMEEFGAKFLHGYPGAIASFALLIKQHKLNINFELEAILFASEIIYEWERKIVEEVFGCRIFSHYGCAEKAVLAAECEKTHIYHCLPEYGITEFDFQTKEIVATGFLNTVNPFIRYKMTDVALNPRFEPCQKCNRNYYPIFDGIEGRLEDFIVSPEGFLIAPAIITHPFKDLKTIKNTQIVQKSHEKIILRIVPLEDVNKDLLNKEIQFLSQELKKIIGEKITIIPEIVNEIELSPSGKFKWIISEISKDFINR
ncbi:MAG TPA: hypothetical protein DEG96_09895 [Candidatus Atribacteria bacterium]|uniref:Phenylacetate--CoA ligase family protein n=1 Tax=candidate division TA06 bacterium 34_109 TaxID=1635277 RepID=A0A101I053_UNCT6|nr:MAG: Uncharacterized protein XE03_1677 [candidate division TA06 bacterium 34_109]HBY58145.1 hypothetical protein [Candidatus Atribacteria bacterium]